MVALKKNMDRNIAKEQKQPLNPRIKTNIISFLFFWWVNSIIRLGNERELQINDLYSVLPGDNSEELGLQLEKEWTKEVEKHNNKNLSSPKGKPSLTRAMFRVFGRKYMLLGFISFIEECILRICQPIFFGFLLQYYNEGSEMSTEVAYAYATGIALCTMLITFSLHPRVFELFRIGMKIRVASCSLVYKKCLKLSQGSLGQTTIGQMVNIMSNDVNRFDMSVLFLHYLWVGPLQALITTVILMFVIGPSCLVGLAILILFAPLQSWLGNVFSRLRSKTAKRTDERIRSMNEIISGMRLIKMYTWETPFYKLIELYRRLEVKVIRQTAYLRAFNQSLFFTSSKLIIFLTLVVYVLTGNQLTSDKVFLTVALFNNIRGVMTLFFPGAITFAAEAGISIQRIETLLLLEVTSNEGTKERPKKEECMIDLDKVVVKWPSADDAEENTLTDISFSVKSGQLLAVVGQVGSGKSSLLNVILGELTPLKGSRKVIGKMAYASQEPWIFSATIRQNILCGSEYDAQRYKRVIKAAALERDFSLFPQGDQTAVGERGVSLSGGQKARVNLARCLYVDADIYLMDDPLSAVDTHVGRHLFDEAINRFLRGKIRVLVTHQLQYLKDADQILVLDKLGRMEAIGTHDELQKKGFDLVKTITEEDELQDEEPVHIASNNLAFKEGNDVRSSTRSRSKSTLSSARRRSTISRLSSAEEKNVEIQQQAFQEEFRTTGGISFSTYLKYFLAGGGYISFALCTLTFVLSQILYSASDYWLNIWTTSEQNSAENSTSSSWEDNIDTNTGIYVYTILIVGVFIFSLIRTVHFFILCMKSSVKLHDQMFHAAIRAPLLFFDRNPVGRILNRFAKDIGCMDDQLPQTLFDVFSIGLNCLGVIVVVGVVNLWLVLPVLILAVAFYKVRQWYLEAARAIKRLEATTRSPVFTHLSSSLVGLVTLRAHHCQTIFQNVFDSCQDIHSSAWTMFLATARWFGIWLDWIAVVYVVCVTYTCVALRGTINGSEAGLVISSAMSLTGYFQWAIRQSAESENQMTSVERVIEYSKLPSEAPLESEKDKKPAHDWPREGNIQFDGMSLRYNDVDQPVLKGITCSIRSKEKIGIVGRTGAGKSSLIASLFRLSEPDGKILIDGIDSKTIGLHDLRSKISIIPQDPFLFSGSLRKNLDPFDEYEDQDLWNAMEDVKLKDSLIDNQTGLEFVLTEGGSNLSVGQRQLVCLARAILRQNKVLVLDEATANVDQKTDSLIQLTIREKFMDCTVLTIAHRLNTIMDSDRVMVLDGGHLKEFDEPSVLLEDKNSMFHSLVEQTGHLAASELIDAAKQAALKRHNLLLDKIPSKINE